MIPASAFSVAANSLRQLLVAEIADLEATNVFISHPKDASPGTGVQALNLFFYRIDWDGFPADAGAGDPGYVRLECLITALGSAEAIPDGGRTISAGENDLRLIGEVMRVLQQNPVLPLADDTRPMQLQAVYQPLSLDQLNHLWSTQPDTPYRMSVAYQFALMPVPLATAVRRSPLLAGVGVDVVGGDYPGVSTAGLPAGGSTPEVPRTRVEVARPDWVPHIAIRTTEGTLRYALRLPDIPAVRELQVLVAGAPGADLHLVWEPWEWDYGTNQGGWSAEVADALSPDVTLPTGDADPDDPFDPALIDPAAPELHLARTVRLPFAIDPGEQVRRQAILYATRHWQRERPRAAPQTITLRSNPLLMSLYREEGA